MSDTSQGPGWWLASDGKWYSPEQAPGYEPASVPATAPSTMPQPGALPTTGTLPPTAPVVASSSGPSTGTLPPTAYPPPGGAPPAGYPPGGAPPAGYPPGTYPPGSYPPGPGYAYPGRAKTSGLAIAAFVLSLLWIFGLGSLLAVIFGIIALVTISRSHGTRRGRGWAIAGLVIGALGLILTVAVSLAVKNAVAGHDLPLRADRLDRRWDHRLHQCHRVLGHDRAARTADVGRPARHVRGGQRTGVCGLGRHARCQRAPRLLPPQDVGWRPAARRARSHHPVTQPVAFRGELARQSVPAGVRELLGPVRGDATGCPLQRRHPPSHRMDALGQLTGTWPHRFGAARVTVIIEGDGRRRPSLIRGGMSARNRQGVVLLPRRQMTSLGASRLAS